MPEPRKRTRARKSDSLPEFETALPKTRRAQVAETLRNLVLSGKLKPGTQLIESRLVSRLGVSRSSIREAIWELIDQGLLVNRPYAGTFVISVDAKAMTDLFSLRGALDRYCFTQIWSHRNETFREELTQRHDALARAVRSRKQDNIIAAELAFHSYPHQFSGSQALLDMWEQLSKKLQLGLAMSKDLMRDSAFIDDNRRYLDLVLGKDLDALLDEIDRHVTRRVDDVRRLMREDEVKDDAPSSLNA